MPAPPTGAEPFSPARDRKSTRLNSSHLVISYAVFCLKKQLRVPGVSRQQRDITHAALTEIFTMYSREAGVYRLVGLLSMIASQSQARPDDRGAGGYRY